MIETDASDGIIAGVLSQLHEDDLWYPVAYFSKTMAPAECNYGIHDKEMLAVVKSLAQWRPEELQRTAKRIQIYTDHKALEYFMTTKHPYWSTGSLGRGSSRIPLYYYVTVRARRNAKADALTRRDDEVELQDGVKARVPDAVFPITRPKSTPEVLRDLGIDIRDS